MEVIKTYDRSFAHEVFRSMDSDGLRALAAALEIETKYDPSDIPDRDGTDYEDFLWEELLEAGIEDVRLDPDLRSFFVVSESSSANSADVYVSADWPSAETFAKTILARQD